MTTVKILGKHGHESLVDVTPEEAQQKIEELENIEGKTFFIVDLETKKIVKKLEIQQEQELAVVPFIRGG